MKNWWAVALGVVFGLLGAGVLFLSSQPPRGNPITLLPPPSPIPLQIHISGAVHNPGVYALPMESRVQDAIEAAGGFTSQANSKELNLAAPLQDGTRVEVPTQTPSEPPGSTLDSPIQTENDPEQPAHPTQSPGSSVININTATQEELETLSGIGPVTAQKIITFREENGPFTSIEEIQKVSGIGPATFEKIKDFITVDG